MKAEGLLSRPICGDFGVVVPGPSQGASRFIQELCVTLDNRHFLGSGLEPILIRAGETCRSDTEVLNNFFGFLPLQGKKEKKKKNPKGVQYLT